MSVNKYGIFGTKKISNDDPPMITLSSTISKESTDSDIENSYVVTPESGYTDSQYTSVLSCLATPLEYSSIVGIQLERNYEEEASLSKWIDEFDGDMYYLQDENLMPFESSKFIYSSNQTPYIYQGDMKNNRPDGYGVLLVESSVPYGFFDMDGVYYNLLYVGEFREGYFDGFGVKFHDPYESISYLYELCPFEEGSDEFTQYYIMWYNYVQYFGNFIQGEKTGRGNYFEAAELQLPELGCDIDYIMYNRVLTGSFRDGQLNGYGHEYENGQLKYEGVFRDGYLD